MKSIQEGHNDFNFNSSSSFRYMWKHPLFTSLQYLILSGKAGNLSLNSSLGVCGIDKKKKEKKKRYLDIFQPVVNNK